MAEVDRNAQLDDVADLFTAAPGSQLAMAQQPTAPATAPIDEAQLDPTAAAFAANWATRATSEELGELLASYPAIPASLDAELLRAVQARHGDLRGRGDLRRAIRASFWSQLRNAGHEPG
ncbi:MAG TPA: hypothetical protein VHN80_01065 [Kineosporiaceae bacterium]|nr:hypothetical protein [Kineosporiaceae bacterium]